MSGLVSRSFRAHGLLCARKPWEVMFLVITATVAMVTVGDWGAHHATPPAALSVADTACKDECLAGGAGGSQHPPSSGSWSQGQSQQYQGVDVVVMTALRCAAMLYTYHQFRVLHRQGSQCIMGIAVLLLVFSSLVFSCSVVKVLGSPLSDLKDAVFFFLLVLDLSKVSRLSSLALSSRSAEEAAASIAQGLALLGPGLTLDTCVEALLVGAGSLSGVRRLEQICQFAVLSILVNYLMLMTFFPASLSLVLQMSGKVSSGSNHGGNHHQPSSANTPHSDTSHQPANTPTPSSSSSSTTPVWQLGYSMHCAAAIMAEESTHNPVLQRVKVIMSAGLVLVHGICRFSLVLPGAADPAAMLHTRNTSEPRPPTLAARWLNDGLEQVVVVVLVVALLIKYAMFEGREELEQQLLRQQQHKQQQDEALATKKTAPSATITAPAARATAGAVTATCSSSCEVSRAVCRKRCDSATQTDIETTTAVAPAGAAISNSSSAAGAINSTCTTTTTSNTAATATNNALPAVGEAAEKLLVEAPARRALQMTAEILAAENGAQRLTDEELVELVKSKLLPGYKLESVLQDCVRGVSVRRQVLAPHTVLPTALDLLPYQHYDYSKVIGVCCESVIGYIPIPVGIAGPLTINGSNLMLPLATTEGCLVASTNRGCRALQLSEEGGVTSHVLQNGMTRAPAVKMPSIDRATELYRWLQDEDRKAELKAAFDSTSSFARMEDVNPTLNGRKLHLRFLAFTGDAMGMNMVSKGVEAALKLLQERFPDMEVVSISGNLCTDKKPSAVNWVKGRGKYVVCGAVVPGAVVRSVLKTTVPAIVNCHIAKNLEGSALAGSIGGNNAHAANIVAALFIACGQDPAQVVGSSNCITQLEACGPDGEDLFASVTMPSLEVGTVGGGTALPAQSACLNILGVRGAHSGNPGQNAVQLAHIVAGAVMAGELSLMAALTAGHLVNSHMKHNRAKPTPTATSEGQQQQAPSQPASTLARDEQQSATTASSEKQQQLAKEPSMKATTTNTVAATSLSAAIPQPQLVASSPTGAGSVSSITGDTDSSNVVPANVVNTSKVPPNDTGVNNLSGDSPKTTQTEELLSGQSCNGRTGDNSDIVATSDMDECSPAAAVPEVQQASNECFSKAESDFVNERPTSDVNITSNTSAHRTNDSTTYEQLNNDSADNIKETIGEARPESLPIIVKDINKPTEDGFRFIQSESYCSTASTNSSPGASDSTAIQPAGASCVRARVSSVDKASLPPCASPKDMH